MKLAYEVAMWLTPNVPNGGRSVSPELVASKGMTPEGEKRTVGLESQVKYWNANSAATNSQSILAGTDAPIVKAPGWPTPRGTDGTKGGPNQAGSKGDLMLPSAAAQWPTPSASVANDGESPETWHARAALLKIKHGNGNGAGLPLTIAASQWPTPAARDAKGPNSQEHALVTGGGQEAHGPVSQLRGAFDAGLFAPGPTDSRWGDILAAEPWRAPAIDKATESLLHGAPDGLAGRLDFANRAARLKCCGNGVVPLQAGAAAVVLIRRMMEAA